MDWELLRAIIGIASLLLSFLMVIPIIVCMVLGSAIGLFFFAGMLGFATVGMISGGFATGRFGGSVDYRKNKVLVVMAWIFYILLTIGLFGVAIYENFFVEH